ncbi:LPS export ABC transporter periplasmic protein LptC [Pseudoalteromonas denitrificans]|uniref:Lipopolysaccharide export system protein LptC n=1 Tax=Pseudoalteromonas denitrificans DSM 6059 TaxID=1123010 RepID=A0A1I1R7P9_9GAMM|nr:LPS export ABC transporter periplasmic protein LptC [Pseudoalteromonas denitrificans]SFD30339.1 lipopolysaccharide export system protein LptC [Pseudoalteromonas denitrificans DSM 6059]
MNLARLILSALFISIMLWLWYPYLTADSKKSDITPEIEVFPDYTANALKQTVFDKKGNISHKVTAKKMELYQDLGFTHFTEPTFTLFSESDIWTISAAEATLYENNDDRKLILEQNVIAINQNPTSMVQKITTEQIEVYIQNSTMHTDHLTKMIGPNLSISGKGLNANLKNETLELINHTQTIYDDQEYYEQ